MRKLCLLCCCSSGILYNYGLFLSIHIIIFDNIQNIETKEPEVSLRLFHIYVFRCPLSEVKLTVEPGFQLADRHPDLLHAVPVTDRDGLVRLGIEIVCDAERRSDLILSSVTLSDRSTVIKLAVVLLCQLITKLHRRFGKLLGKRKHTNLNRSQRRMEMKNRSHIVLLRIEHFLIIRRAEKCQNNTVCTKGRFDDIRQVLLAALLIKISHILARDLLVTAQVIIGSVSNAQQLAPAKREQELDIGCSL